MCGRFTLTAPSYAEVARLLGVGPSDAFSLLYRPRWNVAPTDAHWMMRTGDAGTREIVPASWGLTPPPSRPSSSGAKRGPLINARSETARRMPGVRESFASRRCIIPVDGFYEWVGDAKARRPIWFSASAPDLLRFAGVWESVQGAERFTIFTTAANDVVAPVHDRMPVIIAPADVDAWLGADPDVAAQLLAPAPVDLLVPRAVSPRANSVKNDEPGCLDPWDPTLEVDLRDAVDRPKKARRRGASKETSLALFAAEGPAEVPDARKRVR